MSAFLEIISIHGREILDSRGNPTVETEIVVDNHVDGQTYIGRAAVPSGASTGMYEACELRDGSDRYLGRGVQQAVKSVNEKINSFLIGQNALEQTVIDYVLKELDGTENKSNLGANAILSVSLACARAAANAMKMPLYRYLGGIGARIMPVPLMNILNGGAHAKNNLDFQEFMIMPIKACCFGEALRMGTECYHHLKKVLEEKGLSTAVGDEGGFAPNVDSVKETLDLLMEAIKRAGYEPGKDIGFALDVASSEWKSEKGCGYYRLPKENREYKSDELIDMYRNLVEAYPIYSIEDPLDEEDWEGWMKITEQLGNHVQLVGDDLFVTNTKRLRQGIEKHCGNSILIKLNQIGTLSETIQAIDMAHKAGFTAIASHRSGETEDTLIADLAVALNMGQIKTGAPCRSERVAKYNQLLRIEEEMGRNVAFEGRFIK